MKGSGIGVLLLIATFTKCQASVCTGSGGSECTSSDIACGPQGSQVEYLDGWGPKYLKAPAFKAGGITCTWVIKAQYGQIVHMEAEEVHMGDSCYSNSLQVYDGTAANKDGFLKNEEPKIIAACNQNPFPPAARDIVANGDVTVKFTFKDDDDTTKFKLKFFATAPEGYCDANTKADNCEYGACGDYPAGSDGCIIKLGDSRKSQDIDAEAEGNKWNEPYPFGNATDNGGEKNCKVTYVAPVGSQVAINFIDMDMKGEGEGEEGCNSDYVMLQDSEDTPHGLIGTTGMKFCGQHLPNYPAPSVFASGKEKLIVSYKSDASGSPRGNGFKAAVTLVNPAAGCGSKLTYQHVYGNEKCAASCVTTPPVVPKQNVCEDVKTPFTVTVVDKDTGEEIPNAVVEITSVDLPKENFVSNLTTGDYGDDDKGKCTAQIPEGANYTIKVSHPDYEWKAASVENPLQEYPCDGTLKTIIFLTHNIACEGPFMAKAIDKDTGEEVPEAELSIKVTLDDKFCARHRNITKDPNADCSSYLVKPNVTMKPDGTFDGKFKSNGVYEVTVGKLNYTVVTEEFTIDCHYNDTTNCSKCEADFPVKIEKMTCNETVFVVVVRDEDTEKPIAGATVVVTQGKMFVDENGVPSPNKTELTTDDEGRIEINGMPKGDFDIAVSAEHYDPAEAGKTVDCDLYHCEACLPVVPVKLTHTINPCPGVPFNIYVYKEGTAEALNGANVTLTRIETREKPLDNAVVQTGGKLSINVTNNATYEILVTKPFYESSKIVDAELCCDMSDIRCIECNLTQGIPLKPIECESATLIVQVNDSFTGNPIKGANVSITLTATPEKQTQYYVPPEDIRTKIGTVVSFKTDEDGTAVTNVGEMSDYTITVTHPDYDPMVIDETIECEINKCAGCAHLTDANPKRKPPVCDAESRFEIHIEYTNQSGVEVPLVDAEVTIKLLNSTITHEGTNTTDAEGLVTPLIRYDGTYSITAKKDGFSTETRFVTVNMFEMVQTDDGFRENQTCPKVPATINLPIGGPPSCEHDYVITVHDVKNSHKPLVGATVEVDFTSFNEAGLKKLTKYGPYTTDTNGQVNVTMNHNGNYSVTVLKDGYDKKVQMDQTDCPMVTSYNHEGWEKCQGCFPSMLVNVTMPHCDILMPVTVRNKRTNEIIDAALVKVTLVETSLGTAIKRTYENNQQIPDLTTNDKGVATFNVTAIGLFDIAVEAEGYVPTEIKRHEVECDPRECGDCSAKLTVLLLEKFCDNYTITVVVRNAQNNDGLKDARLTVVHETRAANGGDKIFDEAVPITGELKVKVESKGTYVIEVTKVGYKTQTVRHNVDIELGECDGAAPIYAIIVPEVPCEGGVTVSLTWLAEPKDLDLYGYKVGQANDNQTRCLVYYCDGKDPCDCAEFLVDNKNGGLAGAETIKYCCADELKYTHMLYVDDFSSTDTNGKKSLEVSGAKIYLSGVDRTEIVPIDAAKSKGFRYWLAGCLVFYEDKWVFLDSQDYQNEKPHITEPLYCNSMWVADQKTLRGEWKITVTVKSAEDNSQVIAGASVTASSGSFEVTGKTNDKGVAVLDVEVSGLYEINVQANGFIEGARSAFVMNSVEYNAQAMVALSPTLDEGSVRLILGWNESPKDMDLHTLQVTKPSGTRSCHTFWRNRNTCASTGVHLDVDNRDGGYNGVETITLSDVADNFQNTYMVWVDDYGGGGSSLEKSGSQVTITDGKNTQIARMPAFGDKTPAGVRYWIVGCVAIIGETYKFVEKSKFTEEDPTMDNEKYCHNYFEENPPTLITPPAFCPKVALEVVSFDPLTNKPVDIDQSVVSLNDGLGWKIVASETDVGSTHSIPLSQDGDYTVSLTAGNIDNGGAVNVACNIQKCSECKPKLSVPMLDKASIVNQSILRLNWESDVDLDLIVSEEIFDTKYRKWDSHNCLEKSLLPQACEKVTIEATATRGFNQGEAMSIKDDQDKKYLVYVDTHKNEVKQSGAQVKFYSKSTRNGGGNEMTWNPNFETKKYAGQRYWVVGCIGGDTTGDNTPYMYFDPYPVFLDKDPITESEYKSYCFGKNG